MVVLDVFRTVCIVWYSLSECAYVCVHVCERDPKYWQAWLLFGRWDYLWLLFIPLYLSVSSEFFCYWVYITFIIRKKERYFFLGEKQIKLLLNAKTQQRTQGEELSPGLQKLILCLTEWRRRRYNLYKCHPGSLLSWVSPDCHGVTNKGYSWTLTDL